MKIVIDTRMYGLEHAGIGRYVSNLVREIKCAKDTCEVVAQSTSSEVGGREKSIEICLLVRKSKLKEIKKEVGDSFKLIIVDAPHYSLKEQILLPIQLFKLKPDLVHFTHFNVPIFWWGKQVVTIHDLIKHESRGMETTTRWRPFYWFKYLNYRFLVWLAVKRATKVIVPSQWWKRELVKRYKLPRNKVVVTYEGVDEKFKLKAQSSKLKTTIQNLKVLDKYKIQKPFVTYTGNLYPHKNVERLVRALKKINTYYSSTPVYQRKKKLNLVVICARNVFYERFKKKVKQMVADKFVNLVGFVPDEELVVLYRQAEAFVFPSLMEGFGLPGLEAMACGCPVAASNSSCLPEVYGDAALYFDPLNINEMIEKIKAVISKKSTREELIKRGFKQAKKYSWQKMAEKTLRVYNSVLC